MSNYYEFENMERKLADIQERWEAFGRTMRSALEPLSAARFNKQEYGERATEEKITKIIRRAGQRLADKRSAYTSGVLHAVYESEERIKGEAKIAAQTVERLNLSLAQWTSLNAAFTRGEYRYVAENAGHIDTTLFDAEVKRLCLLLQREWCGAAYLFCRPQPAVDLLPPVGGAGAGCVAGVPGLSQRNRSVCQS